MPQETPIEYTSCKLRMLRELYQGKNNTALQHKVKAKIDATEDLCIMAKVSTTDFIQKHKDLDVYHMRWRSNSRMQNSWSLTRYFHHSTYQVWSQEDASHDQRCNPHARNNAPLINLTMIANKLSNTEEYLQFIRELNNYAMGRLTLCFKHNYDIIKFIIHSWFQWKNKE